MATREQYAELADFIMRAMDGAYDVADYRTCEDLHKTYKKVIKKRDKAPV